MRRMGRRRMGRRGRWRIMVNRFNWYNIELTRDSKTGLMIEECASSTESPVSFAARAGRGLGV